MNAAVATAWDVPGQHRAAAVIQRAVAAQEVGHAWAFVGPGGVGQERVARLLAAALNCTVAGPDRAPCGHCHDCERILRGAHPAYFEFVPTGAFHRVDDVRDEWLPTAYRTVAEGRAKVLRIVDGDRMNESAANAFLKGLEEPPATTVWILDLADPDELPDTILSRCRVVRFAAWGRDDLSAAARDAGLGGPDQELAVRLAMGSPVTLARLAAAGGLDDLRFHRSILARLRADGPGFALLAARALEDEVKRRTAVLQAAGKTEADELAAVYGGELPRGVARQVGERQARREREAKLATLRAAIDDLVAWCRDAVLVAAGGHAGDVLHVDDFDTLGREAEAIGPRALLGAVDRLSDVRDNLELNVGSTLALEAVFLEIASLVRGH